MQIPANPAIFPGTGEGLLEAIIVLQSCGKTRLFFFFSGSRVFSLRAQLQYVGDIQTHTYTYKYIMKRPGRTLSVYLLNERRLHTGVGEENMHVC